jgi:hypothetical protein
LIAPARTFKLLSKVILVHIKGKRRPFRPNPEAEKLIFGTNSFQANFGLYFVFRLGFAVSYPKKLAVLPPSIRFPCIFDGLFRFQSPKGGLP